MSLDSNRPLNVVVLGGVDYVAVPHLLDILHEDARLLAEGNITFGITEKQADFARGRYFQTQELIKALTNVSTKSNFDG
jgi:hypothetical protein